MLLQAIALLSVLGLASCDSDDQVTASGLTSTSPAHPTKLNELGDPANGQIVFRFETFGNENFWTDAAKLSQGIFAAQTTPMQALNLGLSVNFDALDSATRDSISCEIADQGTDGPLLNSFATTVKLLNANAIIGVVAKDTTGLGHIDVMNGSKIGVSCVLCHGIADGSVLKAPGGGTIGQERDGVSNHALAVGKIFALAANTRALFPMAQLQHTDGSTIGPAPTGLTKNSTEAEFDAYFSNTDYYPLGSFDDTVDGNGNPMHIQPLFRQDLAAPYGSTGELATIDQFSNTVYTVLLDPTDLLTPGGKAFLHLAAGSEGDALAADYAEVLAATGVQGYPYVARSATTGTPGQGDSLIGLKLDHQKLIDMNAYLVALRAPSGVVTDAAAVRRGRALFQGAAQGCISCHNSDQSLPVQSRIVDMDVIFPGDDPVILATRTPPLNPVENTVDSTFDDKDIVINASLRGLNRGIALPLLMDLARKPAFLHDNSVATLDDLLNPDRGDQSPHPFYLSNECDRADVAAYLESLDDTSN